MTNFFEQYYIKPIIERTGYNPVSTITYGLLLVIGAYGLFKLLKKTGYEINIHFFKATTPFIILVSVWHVLTDAGVYPYGFLTTTPGLYIPVLSIYIPLMIIAKKTEKKYKWPYEYVYTGVSTALMISQLIIFITLMIEKLNIEAMMRVIYYTIIMITPIILLGIKWKPLKNKLNNLMLTTNMFDASATHVSVAYYNYFEQHVIPRLVFNLFGSSISFYAWKIIVLGTVIYSLDYAFKTTNKKDKELTRFIKIIFITYGLATGLRGFLRLIIGV